MNRNILTKLTIVDNNSSLRCMICGYLMDDPCQSTTCGCRSCRRCWIEYLNNEEVKYCPGRSIDCKNMKVSFRNKEYLLRPDPAAKRDSKRVVIYCINKNAGCQKEMQMEELDDHLRTKCQHNLVECDKCHGTFLPTDIDKHPCDMEFEDCHFCNRLYTRRDLNEKHNNLLSPDCCDQYRGPCPYCNYSCRVQDIKQHKENCKSWIHDCKFKEAGCDFHGTKDEVKEHVENGVKHHIEIAGEAILQNQNKIDQYGGKLKTLSIDATKLNDKIIRSNELAKSSINRIQNFRSDPVVPSAQNHYIPPANHKSGLFVWKIVDVNLKRQANTGSPHISSEPFYSSQYGYKICARIYLNGDGQATGNYMSLFIVLMKGEYDDILTWPFTNKVTVSLLDQEGKNDHSHTFRPDPNSECFKQPDSDMNTASGVPSFYSLTSLQNSRYLKNDTIYVKVRIHASNS